MSHPAKRMAQKFFTRVCLMLRSIWGIIFLVCILNISIPGCSSSSRITTIHEQTVADTIDQAEDLSDDSEMDEEELLEDEIPPVFSTALKSPAIENNPVIDRQKFLTKIMGLMGIRYRRSSDDSTGFDCSGFAVNIFNDALGITLPRSCGDQYKSGTPIMLDSLKFGDLVFFKTRKKRPSHVGIYVGDGLFAHASLSIGVTISLMESEYYRKRFLGARRIVE
jgi:hypothetical protein